MIIFKVVLFFFPAWNDRVFSFMIFGTIPLVVVWYAFVRKRIFKEDLANKIAGYVSAAYTLFFFVGMSLSSSTGTLGFPAILIDAIVLDLLVYFASLGFLRLRKRA